MASTAQQPETLHGVAERERMLAQMQAVKDGFYAAAVRIGNHPFLEFVGLLHEYIEACRSAHSAGIDFTQCNAHSGVNLPLHGHQIDYINEKLSCIFTGRSVMSDVYHDAPSSAARRAAPSASRLPSS